MHLEDERIM